MQKAVGIVGSTGRMGQLLREALIQRAALFTVGPGFSRSQIPFVSLQEVFQQNDYIIDFSQPALMDSLLSAALECPKPLVIGTTGWSQEQYFSMIRRVAKTVPVVIAPNTSVGAHLQRALVSQAATVLGEEYDIDIMEKHHRHKVDVPSGTAKALAEVIQTAKQTRYQQSYNSDVLAQGPRPSHFIGMMAQRSGNTPGIHEVSFTNGQESILIQHVVFDRALFAQGAVRIVEWLAQSRPIPGLYTMQDVLC